MQVDLRLTHELEPYGLFYLTNAIAFPSIPLKFLFFGSCLATE